MKNTLKLALLASPYIAATMPFTSPNTITDSVRDFSGTQGQNGWYYGYWDQSLDVDGSYDPQDDFRLFSHFGADPINGLSQHTDFSTGQLWFLEDGRYYTSLWAAGGHPHGTMDLGSYAKANHWVVRRWVSTVKGQIGISGHAGKTMPWGENWGGDIKFLIMAGDHVIHEASADDGGQGFTINTVVQIGTPIDFMIGPGSAIGVTQFTASVKAADGFPLK
ncbi:hypothetical protein [Marinicella meishanensis]|uniref:hypothetical protein n=1 Tax=Marinicella meishanensis TaxID=2873263 RepID=UPI001CC015EA|nr:hypothetical protein [Marinicella sp. NBU2979]